MPRAGRGRAAAEPAARAALRALASVDALLGRIESDDALRTIPRRRVVEAIRTVLAGERRRLLQDGGAVTDAETLARRVAAEVGGGVFSLAPVINATGVVLHTNLGRALLSALARERLMSVAGAYSNLEMDLARKERGSRYSHVEGLLRRLTGAWPGAGR